MIFISYRRQTSSADARAIECRLRNTFGQVFIDIDMDRIINFETDLRLALEKTLAMVVIIGPNWAHLADAQGNPRIQNSEDYVYKEIMAAIARDVVIAPVRIEDSLFPTKEVLPEPLWPMLQWNYVRVTHEKFASDMVELERAIIKILRERKQISWIGARRLGRQAEVSAWFDGMVRENQRLMSELERAEGKVKELQGSIVTLKNEEKVGREKYQQLVIEAQRSTDSSKATLDEMKQQLAAASNEREMSIENIAAMNRENMSLRVRNESFQAEVAALKREGRSIAEEMRLRLAAPVVSAGFSKTLDKLGQTVLEVIVPSLGHVGPRFQIVEWLVSAGDKVEAGQLMCRITAHGKMLGLQCPATGRVLQVYLTPNVFSSAPRSVCSIVLHQI